MNNFRIYFKETTVLEVSGEKITFQKGKSIAFRNISDKDMRNIRKAVIKKDTMLFSMTDDTAGVFKVVYGNKNKVSKNNIADKVKSFKGSKKDKFKNYIPKETKKEQIKQLDEDDVECVKITQNLLPQDEQSEIINTEGEGTNEQI